MQNGQQLLLERYSVQLLLNLQMQEPLHTPLETVLGRVLGGGRGFPQNASRGLFVKAIHYQIFFFFMQINFSIRV
jgi:hypothetical protein